MRSFYFAATFIAMIGLPPLGDRFLAGCSFAQESPSTVSPGSLATTYAEVVQPHAQAALKRWEPTIAKMLREDAKVPPDDQSILFLGSSSIRLWDSLHHDLAPYRCIQRGYGGARFTDLAVFAAPLIRPHRFRAVVIFVANDIAGRASDLPANDVIALLRYVRHVIADHQPEAEVFVIQITPTQSRWDAWPAIANLNSRMLDFCQTVPRTHFIATADAFLNHQGQVKAELFRDDKLHLNAAGYEVWAARIRKSLDELFSPPVNSDTKSDIKQ